MTTPWLNALCEVAERGQAAVLVTVVAVRGSAPREAGAKMVVTGQALHGTIGGGNLEYRCAERARALLATQATLPVVAEFPLGPALGQCCGGHVTVLLEPIVPPAWRIALFGAGHVGAALAALLAPLPCRLMWIDPRPNVLSGALPANVTALRLDRPAGHVDTLAPGTFVVVVTHDHALDFDIVAASLARPDLPFVGLIGSATKRARFVRRLAARGLDPSRLVCPVGIPGAGGKLPAEIAIAIAAQLLQARDAARPAAAETACGGCALAPIGCAP